MLLKPDDPFWWQWIGNELDSTAEDDEIITFLSERLRRHEEGWLPVGHVDPPEVPDDERPLVFYLGPNHYPAGLYLPAGYDLESHDGDDDDWTIFRARDSISGQILTIWAVGPNAGEAQTEDELAKWIHSPG